MEVDEAGTEDNMPHTVPRSLVLTLIKNLKSVLNYNAFIAVELVPHVLLDFVCPSPVQ
jgi:hypothetical protein